MPSAFEFEKRMAETIIVVAGNTVKLRYDTVTNTFEIFDEITKIFKPIDVTTYYD